MSDYVIYAHIQESVTFFNSLRDELNPSCKSQLTKYDELNASCKSQLIQYVELNASYKSQLTKFICKGI
jgi:hypothetical protein